MSKVMKCLDRQTVKHVVRTNTIAYRETYRDEPRKRRPFPLRRAQDTDEPQIPGRGEKGGVFDLPPQLSKLESFGLVRAYLQFIDLFLEHQPTGGATLYSPVSLTRQSLNQDSKLSQRSHDDQEINLNPRPQTPDPRLHLIASR